MNNKIKKFLQFNGKTIYFLSKDGTYWIALKPICDALEVNFNRQFKNIKKDKFLSEALAIQPMVDAKNSTRNMIALPEFYLYGWLFQIQSGSDALQKYRWECYKVLYNYFQGTVIQRQSVLLEKIDTHLEIDGLETELRSNEKFQRYEELKAKEMRIGKKLKDLDKQMIDSQLTLFQ